LRSALPERIASTICATCGSSYIAITARFPRYRSSPTMHSRGPSAARTTSGTSPRGAGFSSSIACPDRRGITDQVIAAMAGNDAAQRPYERRGFTPGEVILLRLGTRQA
jgi:hypothetical protein